MIAWTHAFASMPREAKRLLRRRADVEVKRFVRRPLNLLQILYRVQRFAFRRDLPADAVGEFFLRDWA